MNKWVVLFLILGVSALAAEPVRVQALKQYIRAMQLSAPAEQASALLEVLELDPSDKAALRSIFDLCLRYPEVQERVAEGLARAAAHHPASPGLNLLALRMRPNAGEAGRKEEWKVASEVIAAVGNPNLLSPEERNAYMELLVLHLSEMRKLHRFAEADALLTKLKQQMPVGSPVLTELQGKVRYRAVREMPDVQHFSGLFQSERADWQDKLEETMEELRASEAEFIRLLEFERRIGVYLQIRYFDDACRLAEQAVRKLERDPGAKFLQVDTWKKTRRYQEAYAGAKQLLKLAPKHPLALKLLADTALRCRNYQEAESAARSLSAISGHEAEGGYFLVMALLLQERYADAERAIDNARDEAVRDVLANVLKSFRINNAEELGRLRREEAAGKATPDLYMNMLAVAERTGDAGLLEHCWTRLAAMSVLSDPNVANTLGYTAAVIGVRLDEARKLLETALNAEPDNGAYLDSMAWVCYRLEKYAEAQDYIRQVLSMPDEDHFFMGTVYMHAGDIALKLGDEKAALDFYRQAQSDPMDPELDRKALQTKLVELEKKIKGEKDGK